MDRPAQEPLKEESQATPQDSDLVDGGVQTPRRDEKKVQRARRRRWFSRIFCLR